MTIASLRKEIYKMGLEYLVVTEIKEVEKKKNKNATITVVCQRNRRAN